MTTPRRASGQITARFQPTTGRRSAADQFNDRQQISVDLEEVAIALTAHGLHGWADRLREIARRNAE